MEKKDQPAAESLEFEEEDVIDLTETLQEDDIIDLDRPVSSSEDQSQDDAYDLDEFLAEKGGLPEADDVIDLVQPADPEGLTGEDDDEEIIELMNALVEDDDEEVIELLDSVTQVLDDEVTGSFANHPGFDDETIDLVEPVTQVLDGDEIIDLAVPVVEDDETIIDLTQTMDDDEIIDLTAGIEASKQSEEETFELLELSEDEEILDLTNEIEVGLGDKTVDLIDEVGGELSAENADEEEVLDLTEGIESSKQVEGDTLEFLELGEDEEILDLTNEIEAGLGDKTVDLTDEVGGELSAENADEEDVIDLTEGIGASKQVEEETLELLELSEDEEILDLTNEIEAGLSDKTIELTDEVDEIEPAEDDDVIDLSTPVGAMETVLDDEDIIELDQTLAGDEALADSLDDRTLEAFDEPTIRDFAEQTSDNLQFDLSESVEGSKHSIINAEPVDDAFDFDSFAEQTTGNLNLDSGAAGALPGFGGPAPGRGKNVEAADIEKEIDNLSLDIFEEAPTLADMDDTDIFDSAPRQESDSQDDLFEKTWDERLGQNFDKTVEMDYDPGADQEDASGDEDKAIAEVLGIDVADMKGSRAEVDDAGTVEGRISQAQLELAVERVIRKLYGEKLDEIFREVIGKAISEDIGRIREVLKKES